MKHFIYLTNSRLVSLVTQRKHIVARREFAVSGAGAAQFEDYLAQMDPVPTYLFADIADEDFRLNVGDALVSSRNSSSRLAVK